jgi:5-formyltetrahydrofolate cyclo-ligase
MLSLKSPSPASLRRQFRALRRGLSPLDQRTHANLAARHFANARLTLCFDRFAVYVANDGELDAAPIVERLLAAGKLVALPVIGANRRLTFHRYRRDGTLALNRYGIPEPEPTTTPRIAPATLDVVLLPLVAFDTAGRRLGMGGGYYDATFANQHGALRVGLAHALQCSPAALPQRAWDLPLDAVITEAGGWGFTIRGRRFFPAQRN